MKIYNQTYYYNFNTAEKINYKQSTNVTFAADIFIKKALNAAKERIQVLEKKNSLLENQTHALEELLKKVQIPGLVNSKDFINDFIQEIKNQFSAELNISVPEYKKYVLEKLEGELNYDPLQPVFNEVKDRSLYYQDSFKYEPKPAPTSVKEMTSTNELFNKLSKEKFLEITFSDKNEKSVIKNPKAYIKGNEVGIGSTIQTDMTKKYGQRVGWSNEKIARDLYQNFYDAHDHSLEGTTVQITKDNNNYKIKISGLSEYEYKNIQYIGAGDKDNDLYNAGGFGEGTKILSAVMLANNKTKNVRFSSANWIIDYNLSGEDNDAIIMRSLNMLETPIKGNYVEFETKDVDLVRKIIDGRNYFYHPQNTDFQDLTFENEHWGFKILPKGEKGNLYMTQRFEYEKNGEWENPLDELVLIFKRRTEKPEILGKNRDRINLKNNEILEVLKEDYIKTMSNKELTDAILHLEEVWNLDYSRDSKTFASEFTNVLLKEASRRFIQFDSGDKKFASIMACFNLDIMRAVEKLGYTLVNGDMYYLGIDNVNKIYEKTRKHIPIMPNEVEKKKLMLLEEGITLLAEDKAMQKRINLEEAQKPRFIYNAKEAKEESTLAESVTKDEVYKGHWVDQKALNKSKFYELLAIWLHEITHKYGGDGSKEFGYKLTDVMGLELESLMNNPERLEKLRFLRSVFDKL